MNDYNKSDGMMNSFFAGMMGAVVGGVAVMMSDDKTRNSVRQKIQEFLGTVQEKKEEGKAKIEEEIKKTRTKVAKIQEDITK